MSTSQTLSLPTPASPVHAAACALRAGRGPGARGAVRGPPAGVGGLLAGAPRPRRRTHAPLPPAPPPPQVRQRHCRPAGPAVGRLLRRLAGRREVLRARHGGGRGRLAGSVEGIRGVRAAAGRCRPELRAAVAAAAARPSHCIRLPIPAWRLANRTPRSPRTALSTALAPTSRWAWGPRGVLRSGGSVRPALLASLLPRPP